MPERLALIFAYHFPPDASAGSQRPYRFAKYLSRMGYEVAVFTACEQPLDHPFPVFRIRDPFPGGNRRTAGWQLERALRKTLWPGAVGIRWAARAAESALAFLKNRSGARACVLSTFPPLGAHLAGWRVAKAARLPWLADFRDPMISTPGNWDRRRPWQRRAALWMERRFFQHAARIVANTSAMAEQFRRLRPESAAKVHTIYNGVDTEERIRPLPLPPRPYRLFSHVGELYGGRSAVMLLESIARLIQSDRLDRRTHRVLLAGPMEPGMLPCESLLTMALEQGWLELRPGFVPKAEALRIAQTSDGLLLIQPHTSIQVPAKLYEYIQIGRPILAQVPPKSETEAVLAKSGIRYVTAYSGSSAEEMDRALITYFRLPSDPLPLAQGFIEEFAAQRQAESLARILESLS
ncbi:MAG: glycosyltransferase [Bryobacteraceae bacterium]